MSSINYLFPPFDSSPPHRFSYITKMPSSAPLEAKNQAKLHSPTLARLLKARPAPSREKTLLEAARSETRPVKPPPGECCGSSCDPCVMELYAQESRVWKECEGLRGGGNGVIDGQGGVEKEGNGGKVKVPGAFEW
jgi:hypothetical protein